MKNSKKTIKVSAALPRALISDKTMARWKPEIHAAHNNAESTINIYDVVGEDFFSEGVTAKSVDRILQKNQGGDVTVNINSPGGDFFEGVAIFNMLKEHDGDVNVRIVGMAASAAAVIAMAGTNVQIAESGFLMIHNAWGIVVGNKNEMRATADTLESFDESMARIFTKNSDLSSAEITAMLDAETWISGPDAVDQGFATELLSSDAVSSDGDSKAQHNASLKDTDLALAQAGYSRAERRRIIKDLTGTPCAISEDEEATPGAGQDKLADAIMAFKQTISNTED